MKKFSYLGDISSETASFEETIKARAAKAIGISTQIMSILKGISLGHFYFQIAVTLRESLFLNGILTNVEPFSPLKQKELKVLIKCDTDLMKLLFNVNSFTNEMLYIDTGKLPIEFIIAKKRLLYLWEICHEKSLKSYSKSTNHRKLNQLLPIGF